MKIEKDGGVQERYLPSSGQGIEDELCSYEGKVRRVALLTVITEIREKTESSIPNIFNNYFLKPSLVIINKM